MTEAVLDDRRKTLTSGTKGNSGVSAAFAQLPSTPKLPATAGPGEGLMRRALRVAWSIARRDTEAASVAGLHRLRKGTVERTHLPEGGRITCCAGSVWITADGGGEDVVLCSGEFRSFPPGAWLLIEAIASSEVLVEA